MTFDVIVVGGGHAGCEAADAAARRGARVALLTFSQAAVGAMSCNPAIGGIGKGHLVREVDAADGLIARAADHAAIHHRMLNASRGAAVRGPRVQADRARYRAAVQRLLTVRSGLEIVEGEAAALVRAGAMLKGVLLEDGSQLHARSVVLATGTFLGGKLHCGLDSVRGGRTGESSAVKLAAQLRDALPMGRMKTGTPPRLDGRTINWALLERQPSDGAGWTMSALSAGRAAPQVACAITRTNGGTHEIIRSALDRSPLWTGAIDGRGPRYCPSIEDKVTRFGDRDGHQLFLEPEGLDDATVYPNGISTSLPLDAQEALVRSIHGLEAARIVQPGYAVEYDHVDPRALDRGLGVEEMPGLFLAGQINGTTGYEEAAAQGLVAGANAAAFALGLEPYSPCRSDSYIGVMIDDLVLQGVTEPYRMLTARAEFRLRLRADNAVERMTKGAIAAGLLGEQRRRAAGDWLNRKARLTEELRTGRSAGPAPRALVEEVEADLLYAPYLARQEREVAALRADEARPLPKLNYAAVPGLSAEMVERLTRARPRTLGELSRVRGVTPAALSAVLVHSKRDSV